MSESQATPIKWHRNATHDEDHSPLQIVEVPSRATLIYVMELENDHIWTRQVVAVSSFEELRTQVEIYDKNGQPYFTWLDCVVKIEWPKEFHILIQKFTSLRIWSAWGEPEKQVIAKLDKVCRQYRLQMPELR